MVQRVIVIGAGWSGIITAKTYLEVCRRLNRPINLTVLDDSTDPGGVWSSQRLYPGLVANSPNGLYEFSDLSMVEQDYPDLVPIPGERVQTYLEAYARKFDVFDKIKFNSKVVQVTRLGTSERPQGWKVQLTTGELMECDKLVVATGLYSKPRIPEISMSTYRGQMIHSRSLGVSYKSLRADDDIKHIVVVGGCKSALEAVSVFLPDPSESRSKLDKHITWVIRPHDMGVPLVIVDYTAKPNAILVNNTRLFSAMAPSIYNLTGFWHSFLHSGLWSLGVWLLQGFVSLMTWFIRRAAKYDSSINGRKIKTKGSNFFYDVSHVSVVANDHPVLKWLHKDDFDVLEVQRATPQALTDQEMIVEDANGKEIRIPADLVIWSTGAQPSIDFFHPGEADELGLQRPLDQNNNAYKRNSAISVEVAQREAIDQDLLSQLAFLKSSPIFNTISTNPSEVKSTKSHSPDQSQVKSPLYAQFRLYRQILPPSFLNTKDRTLTFAGLISSGQTPTSSELTALWAVAWMEDLFVSDTTYLGPSSSPHPQPQPQQKPQPSSQKPSTGNDVQPIINTTSPDETTTAQANHEIRYTTAFQRLRYGAKGARDPEIILEIQSYLDVLCRDLGVRVERKKLLTRLAQEERFAAVAVNNTKTDEENRSGTEDTPRQEGIVGRGVCMSRGGGGIGRGTWTWLEKIKDEFREYCWPYRARDYKGVVKEFLAEREVKLEGLRKTNVGS